MHPTQFYKCIADDTRLTSLLLINEVQTVCVCDLVEALRLDQPKISRHLAELRKSDILQDEREGKWVHYRLHPQLPDWALEVIRNTAKHNRDYFAQALQRLQISLAASSRHC